ncbi:MAG: hypothetical protein V1921_05800 [Candidatus Altiarchaeota archaeon]
MKVGVLEYKDDEFTKDVINALSDLQPEHMRIGEQKLLGGSEYKVIIDRISFHQKYLREYLKLLSLGGCYIINNPFSSEVNNKLVEMKVCEQLRIPFPNTVMLPMVTEGDDISDNILKPNWSALNEAFSFPAIMKPYNGFGWENVYEVESIKDAKNVYEALKDRHILMLQEKIYYREYYRAYCVGKKDVLFVKYQPAPEGMGRYVHDDLKPIDGIIRQLEKWTVDFNSMIDFDFNSVEWSIDANGNPSVIDAFNEVPDIDKRIFPQEEYNWLVDRFSATVRDRFKGPETNKTFIADVLG